MSAQKTMSLKIDGLTIEQARILKKLAELVKVNNGNTYVHMVGMDGSCYKRTGEYRPFNMGRSMLGIRILVATTPDIEEVSIKRPSPGHPTTGLHYTEDVIKIKRNDSE